MISSIDLLLDSLLFDVTFTNKFFELEKYHKLIEKYGNLEYDECFGYFPILATGGSENIENIKKAKAKEYIGLIISFIGELN